MYGADIVYSPTSMVIGSILHTVTVKLGSSRQFTRREEIEEEAFARGLR